MAFDTFIKIDGIPGESSDDKHKDWIEVVSYDHQIEQPASSTASSVGGATAERVNHGTLNFVTSSTRRRRSSLKPAAPASTSRK